tara:strand:- start:723 stop:1610 length:888 start_codon:yes stop_codon:yes gene_type:complete
MFVDNNWYGQRSILAKYCNVNDSHIFAAIQHGMLTRTQEDLLGKRKLSTIPYLCWNNRVLNKLKGKGLKNIHVIGSPFLYLDKMQKQKKINNKGSGTIVFPSKSTYEKKRDVDFYKLIQETEKILPGPYTVSIYYADLNKDLSVFKKKNWKIVSFGKRSDVNFLQKNYDELMKNENVVCTSINTIFFYASFLRKNVKFLLNNNSRDIVLTVDENQVSTQKFYEKEYPGILENKLNINQLYDISYIELGAQYLKNKQELLELLGWNSNLKLLLSYLISKYMDLKHYLIWKKSLRND